MQGHRAQIGNLMHAAHLCNDIWIDGLRAGAALIQLFGDGACVGAGQVHCPDALDMWCEVAAVALLQMVHHSSRLHINDHPQVIPNDHPQVIVRSPPGDPVPILYLSC